ncbi:DUF1326 domain-containing protein [Halomonas binhaiensis]|uniref:DUF1326 domain-containing protein n=1 Tax=Halomonas binhaiensis TaxID=2562282 RepID=A0A5C1NIR8_9GAMM|nr:DUF1326 domain-containing protein [Halomonas binhaiensis]QEM82308.1 DUF1326 domain-containing protein [Halomonas binhaiensis]
MTYVDWMIQGAEITTCNCNWGCPCQFNALPSYGNCRAAVGIRIDEGHFGDVQLDGLKAVAIVAWPGAIHEGHGEVLPIVDERATPEQREAMLKILGGEETEEFATIFNVVKATTDTVHEPLFKAIEFESDEDARIGRFSVEGIVEATAEPILNPVTGQPHRAKVVLPQGFEYSEAEYASSNTRTAGPIENEWSNRHAHFCMLHLGPHGIIR